MEFDSRQFWRRPNEDRFRPHCMDRGGRGIILYILPPSEFYIGGGGGLSPLASLLRRPTFVIHRRYGPYRELFMAHVGVRACVLTTRHCCYGGTWRYSRLRLHQRARPPFMRGKNKRYRPAAAAAGEDDATSPPMTTDARAYVHSEKSTSKMHPPVAVGSHDLW